MGVGNSKRMAREALFDKVKPSLIRWPERRKVSGAPG